jgi:hypothetical protein
MNNTPLPGFTAETSLGRTGTRYHAAFRSAGRSGVVPQDCPFFPKGLRCAAAVAACTATCVSGVGTAACIACFAGIGASDCIDCLPH